MLRGTSFIGKSLGWAMVFGVSLAMAGCGGDSPPPKVDAAPVASSAPVTKSEKAGPKGKNALAPGGDLSPRERRALKQKEKQADGQ
jgi:hypothetical protein